MDSLRRSLDDLNARRMEQIAAADFLSLPREAPAQRCRAPRAVADVLGGRELPHAAGACWWISRTFDEPSAAAPSWCEVDPALVPESAAEGRVRFDWARALVVDIETGGFAGTPVFLIGVIALDQRPLTVQQWLARDYAEEQAILGSLAEFAAERDHWISFNGKSFDVPFLADRARIRRVPLRPPAAHLDVLHLARRRWRGAVPDFRLVTLEEQILGRHRVGDVPSRDVPDLFHHFIRTGNAAPLRPVIEHNQSDLVSVTELLAHLAGRTATR